MNSIRMNDGLLYFAYGANTNKRSMALRCPEAKPLGTTLIEGWRLMFAGVADIIPDERSVVHGALWRITPECEAALDRFEGFPNSYVKQYGKLRVKGKDEVVMMYVMRAFRAYSPPSESYRQCLLEGYASFGLPLEQVHTAVKHALKKRDARRQSDWVGFTTDLTGRY